MHLSPDRTAMFAQERQRAIADLAQRDRRVSVADLAKQFDVTPETVRRDLASLESLGLLRRVHGGAVPADALPTTEVKMDERDVTSTEEKQQIAAQAVRMIPAGASTLVLDAGTTTARVATLLPHDRPMTVVTHSVSIASLLAGRANIELHLLPGRVRRHTHAAVGVDTVKALERIRADIAFLGTNGISASHGLSTPDRAEAAVKQAIVHAAQRAIVLADSSKAGRESILRFAELNEIDTVVTDRRFDPTLQQALDDAGVEVVVA